jgi:hypothetical protein
MARMTIAIGHPASHSLGAGAFAPPRQHGYPLSLRVQAGRVLVPVRVSRQWLSPRGAPLSSFGVLASPVPPLSTVLRRRYDFPSTHLRSLMDSLPQPTGYLRVRARRSAPGRSEGIFRARALACPAAPTAGFGLRGREWDLSGLQTILPVPLLRSSTPVEPTCPRHFGHTDAVPATHTAKTSAIAISGLTHAASAPADLRFAFRVATHAQGSLPAGWLAFTGRASNPLDRYERFQLVLTIIPLSCSPDANGLSGAKPIIVGTTACVAVCGGFRCAQPTLRVHQKLSPPRIRVAARRLAAYVWIGHPWSLR